MTAILEAAAIGAGQLLVCLAAAPLLNGFIKKIKARYQMRRGPGLLQGYRDLAKWLSRDEVVAETSSYVQSLAPFVVLASVLAALLLVPILDNFAPLAEAGDLIVLVGLLALGRALLALGGVDSGGSFGQMGSSREVAISALVEPVLLVSLIVLAIQPQTMRLDEIAAFGSSEPWRFLGLGWGLALAAFLVVLIAETGRIPVDNPDTHLELTMVHEGMLIEYSGRGLGLLNYAAMLKQLLLVLILVNVFLPFGMGSPDGPVGYVLTSALLVFKVAAACLGLALAESVLAKMRIFQLPDLIGAAGCSALLGAAIVVLFA